MSSPYLGTTTIALGLMSLGKNADSSGTYALFSSKNGSVPVGVMDVPVT